MTTPRTRATTPTDGRGQPNPNPKRATGRTEPPTLAPRDHPLPAGAVNSGPTGRRYAIANANP
jgi:hypothetical protein